MPDRRALLIYLALAAVVLGLGARQMLAARDPGGGGESVPAARAQTVPKVAEAASSSRVIVHVAGRVRRPGVYRLREGARVDDAVQRAGGALGDADLTAVNLAAEVEDGRQVVVPAKAAVAAAPGAAAAPGEAPAQPVNLNTATSEQLQELDGVGPEIAAKILAYRQEHGGFGSVKELGDVPGIGEKRLAALEASVTV
ncbi:MAG: helix-hairpin-helix domain-containing protein [Baekduiaceae bacterium]